jgi:hypothetical protein
VNNGALEYFNPASRSWVAYGPGLQQGNKADATAADKVADTRITDNRMTITGSGAAELAIMPFNTDTYKMGARAGGTDYFALGINGSNGRGRDITRDGFDLLFDARNTTNPLRLWMYPAGNAPGFQAAGWDTAGKLTQYNLIKYNANYSPSADRDVPDIGWVKKAIGTVSSGTYTPALTNGANVKSSTAYAGQYMRVGDVVTASMTIEVNTAAAGPVVLGISLPVATRFVNAYGAAGTASTGVVSGSVSADAGSGRLKLNAVAAGAGKLVFTMQVSYRVER